MNQADYDLLDSQLRALLDNEADALAAASNFVGLLFNAIDEINWLGIYVLRGDELVLGPFPGFFYSAIGLFANASVLYVLGYFMGYKTVQQLPGTRTHQLSQRLSRNGLLTITTLRFLPVAPFTVISLIAGASHINYRDYIFGSLLGITPALAIMTLVGNQLARTIVNPDAQNGIIAIVGGALLILAVAWIRHLKKAD